MFNFADLDVRTRTFMLAAIEDADRIGNIYYSSRFNDAGRREWLWLLKQAAREHDEEWLADQLEAEQLMRDLEGSRTPRGGYSVKHVPESAAETFAQGQFNRFYMLGLCLRARADGVPRLVVYRAKDTPTPRAESESLIGTEMTVDEAEAQLRDTRASLQSPLMQPNSGIGLKLP